MHCPSCGKRTRISDSRLQKDETVRRRRICICGFVFFTFETIDDTPISKKNYLDSEDIQLIKDLVSERNMHKKKFADLSNDKLAKKFDVSVTTIKKVIS